MEKDRVLFNVPESSLWASDGPERGSSEGRGRKKTIVTSVFAFGTREDARKSFVHTAMVADTANEAVFAPSITTTRVLKEAAAAVANGTMDSASKRNPSENGEQQNGEISISASGGTVGGAGGEQLLLVAAAKKVRDAEGRRRRRKQKKKSKDGTTVATAAAGKREDSSVDNDSDKEDVAAVEVDSFA